MAVATRTPLSSKKSAPLFVPRSAVDEGVSVFAEHWALSSPHCWRQDPALAEPVAESEADEDGASWVVRGGYWPSPVDDVAEGGVLEGCPQLAGVEDDALAGGSASGERLRAAREEEKGAAGGGEPNVLRAPVGRAAVLTFPWRSGGRSEDCPTAAGMEGVASACSDSSDLAPVGSARVLLFPWRRVEAWPAGEFPGSVNFGKPLRGASDDGAPPSKDAPWHKWGAKSVTLSSAGSDAGESTEEGTPMASGSVTSRSSESGEATFLEEPQDSPAMAESEGAAGAPSTRLRLNANADLFTPRVESWGELDYRPKANSCSTSSAGSGGCAQPELDGSSPCGSEQCSLETLEVSENSWVARRRAARCSRKKEDDDGVAGVVRVILNKMTLEKFPRLSQQLLSCEINTASRMQRLVAEVFEVAITQHHFIDMYADLCLVLHDHFQRFPISEDPKTSFKRLLLTECQQSFTRGPKVPAGHGIVEDESIREAKHRTRSLGNIKLIGALCSRGVLASKVFMAILAELTSQKTEESIEGFAALLTVVGPIFDTPKFHDYEVFTGFFCQAAAIAAKPGCGARSRCLLHDLLDLRGQAWRHTRPAPMEAPMTLTEVERKMSSEDPSWSQGYYSPMDACGWGCFF